jgi:hypothetical protein
MIPSELNEPGSRQNRAMARYDPTSLTISSAMAGAGEMLHLNDHGHRHGQQMGRLHVDPFENEMSFDAESIMSVTPSRDIFTLSPSFIQVSFQSLQNNC